MKTGILAVITLILALTFTAHAQVPGIINYQGRVIDGGTNFDGAGQFKFALVDSAGTTNYWSNDGTAIGQPSAAVSLTVTKGLYSVLLGDTSIANMTVAVSPAVFANSDVRLRVFFNDGVSGFQQLSPDQRLGAVGYALNAANGGSGSTTGDVTGARLYIGLNNTLAGAVASIGGGSNNTLNAGYGVIAGGSGNSIQTGNYNAIGGGIGNSIANSADNVIAGGSANALHASTFYSAIGGGNANSINGHLYSTIGGGNGNSINGDYATVPGGSGNNAGGQFSFAAGQNAWATNDGAFVWADDSSAAIFASSLPNQFLIRAAGGVGINKTNPASALDVNGTVTATTFSGNGSNLTGVSASVADGSITTAKLATGAVTSASIATGAVSAVQLAGGAVSSNSIAAASIGAPQLAAGAVQSGNIAGGQVVKSFDGLTDSVSITAGANVTISTNGNNLTITASGGGGGGSSTGDVLGARLNIGTNNTLSGAYATIAGGSNNTASGDTSTVAGGFENSATNAGATVAGGVNNLAGGDSSTVGGGSANIASGGISTVAGGLDNFASGDISTIGGGFENTASVTYSTIGGGWENTASGLGSVVGGGLQNIASGAESFVGGGNNNSASGSAATVPGGTANVAGGISSFAAGRQAQALHQGSFVWADSQNAVFASSASNQFLIRAAGGVGIGTTNPITALHISGGNLTIDNGNNVSSVIQSQGDLVLRMDRDNNDTSPVIAFQRGSGAFLMTLNANGNLTVAGNICASGTIGSCSDARFKKDVQTLPGALEAVAKLRGVSFAWKTGEFPEHRFADGPQVGFIAQEVKAVLPEVVSQGSDGYYSVDYGRLTPILVEAIKEQQQQIEVKDKNIENLERRLANLETKLQQVSEQVEQFKGAPQQAANVGGHGGL